MNPLTDYLGARLKLRDLIAFIETITTPAERATFVAILFSVVRRLILTSTTGAALLAFVIANWAVNPVQEASDHVGEPALVAAGILAGTCPSGWTDESTRDEHARVKSCSRTVGGTKWLVVLDSQGQFDYGLALDTPGAAFVETPSGVPGWK